MFSDYLKTLPLYLLPQHLLSRLIGRVADCEKPWVKAQFIRHFVKHYDVDLSQAIYPEQADYKSFTNFFIRRLKPQMRAIERQGDHMASPVDGTVSQVGAVQDGRLIQAKGRSYHINELLGGQHALAEPFYQGSFATLYLSPKDYHRVHMPLDATLEDMIYIPGDLFAVNPPSTRVVDKVFARNERVVCLFNTEFGKMALVLVGALIVGGIHIQWHGMVNAPRGKRLTPWHYPNPKTPAVALTRAEEMGYFKLGSTVVLVMEHEVDWGIGAGDEIKLGQDLGGILRHPAG